MPHSPSHDAQPESDASFSLATGRGLGDLLAFSNGVPAAIAIALSLVASQILQAPQSFHSVVIAGCGTFVVYGLDRLRDTDRDRATSPLRTQFVVRHARALRAVVALAAVVLLGALFLAPPLIGLLCLAVGTLGLFHRRLKHLAGLKTFYVSLAWVACCVGIPWLVLTDRGTPGHVAPAIATAGILFTSIAANLVASNHRDGEAPLLERRPGRALAGARCLAAAGAALVWISPPEARPLVWIPLAELLALAFYRPTEHYGQLAVDGALLLGALASLLHIALA